MKSGNRSTLSAFNVIKRLFKLNKKYTLSYIIVTVASIICSLIALLEAEAFRRMINGVTQEQITLFKSGFTIGLIVLIGGTIVNLLREWFVQNFNYRSTLNLQAQLLSKTFRLPMLQYEKFHTGDLVNRIVSQANTAQLTLNDKVQQVVMHILSLAMILTYMTTLNFEMMSATVAYMLVVVVIIVIFSKPLRKEHGRNIKLNSDRNSFIQDSFQGADIVRVYSLSERLVEKHNKIYDKMLKVLVKVFFLRTGLNIFYWLVWAAGNILMIGYGGFFVMKGRLNVGEVVAFITIFEKILEPVYRLTMIWTELQEGIASGGRIFEIFDLPDEKKYEDEGKKDEADIGSILYENIVFKYNDEKKVLDGLSILIPRNKMTAIVGPSGAGKSTILKLLLKLYEPNDGSISVNGSQLQDIKPGQWYSKIGYVPQLPVLFSDTIYENIRFGKMDADEEEIYAAAQAASAHDFIMNLPDGYDTQIGEKGTRLSGGEAQRISLARAILADPELLILDEPASMLDSRNEALIQRTLSEMMKGRTSVIVAHKLSTIRKADCIIYIENGSVIEQGNHEQLMKIKGKYYSMYKRLEEEVPA